MSKIPLLVAILVATLLSLSSCGFHIAKNSELNAVIISNQANNFAIALNKKFNQDSVQNLTIKIGAEVQKQHIASYTTNNTATSYTLSLTVPISILDANQNILLSQDLSAQTHLKKITNSSQADRLQIKTSYTQLRNTLINQLIRRLSAFNEN